MAQAIGAEHEPQAKDFSKVNREFINAVQYFSALAHAREACNGWGGQPIPCRTDLFNGVMGRIIKFILHNKQKKQL